MARRFNKTTLSEACEIFNFTSETVVTLDLIKKTFRKLVLKHHPDKGGNAKKLAKVVESKEVLIKNFDALATNNPNGAKKTVKSVGSVFVDWLKTADVKNVTNPFTTYKKGRTRNGNKNP